MPNSESRTVVLSVPHESPKSLMELKPLRAHAVPFVPPAPLQLTQFHSLEDSDTATKELDVLSDDVFKVCNCRQNQTQIKGNFYSTNFHICNIHNFNAL